ncbi:MAG TPA: membrane protein insertase YidC [Bryobacteraceae bacterium]|jgi:YidC/Oxa1 family membrane protein insertase
MPNEKKELSNETRLLIAFGLMAVVLLVYQWLFPAPPPKPDQGKTDAPKADTAAPKQTAAIPLPATPAPGSVPAADIPGEVQAAQEEVFAIDTDYYHVEFSNRGAVVKSWVMKNFKDQQLHMVDLVNTRALARVAAPFSLAFKGQAPSPDPNAALYRATHDDLSATFEYSDGRIAVKKTFRFEQKGYLVSIASQVTQNGAPLPHALAWRGGFGDSTIVNPATTQLAAYYDQSNSKLYTKAVKEAKDGPVSFSGQFSFAGLEDSYFAGVYLPEGRSVELTEFADNIPDVNNKDEQRIGAAVGGEGLNSFTLFVGPKDFQLLETINPKLNQLIDWSWLGISLKYVAIPISLALQWTAQTLTHNYGWAIILVTAGINMVMFPLKFSSMRSSRKMQSIQPLVTRLNEKYKGLPLKDPRQQEKNAELMELYKLHGINPLGGCLPMLLTLPFFVAFYKVLSVTIQLRGAPWLWVHDLSQPETLAIRLLPLILAVTQFAQQKMTPSPGMDPSQQKMMMLMPLMLLYMFYFANAGLVLYWLTSNVVGIAQQWALNRLSPPPAVVVDTKSAPKKKNRN